MKTPDVIDVLAKKLIPLCEKEEVKFLEIPVKSEEDFPRGSSKFMQLSFSGEQKIAPKWRNLDFQVHIYYRILKNLSSRLPLAIVDKVVRLLDNQPIFGNYQISNKIKFVSYQLDSEDTGGFYHFIINFKVDYGQN